MENKSRFPKTLGSLIIQAAGIICFISLLIVSFHCTKGHSQTPPVDQAAVTARNYNPGTIRHIVLFKYNDGTTATQKQNVITAFLDLKNKCTRNGAPYVVDIEYGFPSSKEGADQGMEVGFFVTFASEGDRNFYVGTPYVTDPAYYDPAHAAFKSMVGPLLATNTGVIVYDYKKLP
jgi:hypothetical protein